MVHHKRGASRPTGCPTPLPQAKGRADRIARGINGETVLLTVAKHDQPAAGLPG